MKGTVTEKLPYTRGKAVLLSTVCVLLTLVLTVLLLTCMTAHKLAYEAPVAKAFSEIPLEEVTLSDGTPLVTRISRDYLGEGVLTEEQIGKILQSKSYRKWLGEKAENYVHYITFYQKGEIFPEILTPEIEQLVRDTEDDIQLFTGIHHFTDENPQFFRNLKPDLENWNHKMRDILSKGAAAILIRAAVSRWMGYVLGGLLLLLFVWLLVIHVKGRYRVGTACRVYAVTGFVPSVLLLLWGLFGSLILKAAGRGYLQETAKMLRSAPLMIGVLACLACAALFGFGVLSDVAADAWHSRPKRERSTADIGRKREMSIPPQPVKQPVPELVPPAPAPSLSVARHYCRFCGGELVNTDAKFCYKCGKAQE